MGFVKFGLIILSAIFDLSFGIAALIIHLQNNDPDPACSTRSTFLSLSRWAEGFGIGHILIFVGYLPMALSKGGREGPGLLIWFLVLLAFNIAWAIVGSVVLFQYGYYCQWYAYSLWAVSLASLIDSYVLIAVMGALVASASKIQEMMKED